MRQPGDLLYGGGEELDFGTFLKLVRTNTRIKQGTIAALLQDKGWTPTTYTRLENGNIAPRFADLLPLYRAFIFAGVSFSLVDRQHFVEHARKKIEGKKTHRERRTDAEWAELRYELARLDGLPEAPLSLSAQVHVPHKPLLADTEHLIGRESWREEVLARFKGPARAKVLVIQGPAGIGKSSELNWLAAWFFRQTPTTHRVILCDLRSLERLSRPEDAFHVFVSTLLIELGYIHPQTPFPSLDEQTQLVLEQVEKARMPLVVFLDHAEYLFQPSGELAPCWERFLTHLLRGQHGMTLVLASKEWPGWYHGECQFVAEHLVPPLPRDKSILVLQQQGLDGVPIVLLEQVYEQVRGVPLALEWVAALLKQPLEVDDWEEFGSRPPGASRGGDGMIRAIERLLAEPHIFGGSLADDLAPVLQRIIATQHLSVEAHTLLEVLSVATIPLAKPALQVLCPQGPRPLKELRRASVLVSYPDRIQLLPMVAAAMHRHLTAEQRKEREGALIEACKAWIKQGSLHEHEQSAVITELATLLLKHQRLVEAAEHLIYYGWISFKQGHGHRLARLAEKVMQNCNWQKMLETECAGLLLQKLLFRFLGKKVDSSWHTHYKRLYDAMLAEKIELPSGSDHYLTHLLMMYAMNELRFEEAQVLLDAYGIRLEGREMSDPARQRPLFNERAWFFGKWCEYAEEQGDEQKAKELREQVISLYQKYYTMHSSWNTPSPLSDDLHKKKLAHCLTDLSYHLNRSGRYEEALEIIEQGIELDEQGYALFGTLAASYGEKSQILMELGRFQEALLFDEKAVSEIQRCADTGDALSRDELWIYLVNRGRLYLRLGRVEEAERLLQEALSHRIRPERRRYRMFAEEALGEIEQWRQQAKPSHYQLDWRWVERYRELAAYDSHGWLAYAGPFTIEEQQQWEQLFTPPLDAAAKEQVGELLARTCDRELTAALAEQREPRLYYPAVEIEEVRCRITALLKLDTEISQQEPNAIVRRLYQGAIEEEVDFLRVIEASYEGDTDKYWTHMQRLLPPPTPEEMDEALGHIKRMVILGLQHAETAEVSQRFREFLLTHLHISIELPTNAEEIQEVAPVISSSPTQEPRTVSTQAAKRFFEAALHERDYEGWQVMIDSYASGMRVEQGLRQFFLPNRRISLREMRKWLVHEVAGHVARCMAGERSPLGLLGIHTKNSLPTEEGFTLYHERQIAALHGQPLDEAGHWLGTLATGLASGVVTPPQTFLSLHAFFVCFSLLRQLLQHPDADVQKAQKQAQQYAFSRCLRTYIGVPDFERAGVCYLQDAVYLRGIRMVERAVAEDKTVLDRLAVGVIALELLPDLEELGIVSAPQSLIELAYDPDLNSRILSFEEAKKQAD